MNLTKLLIEMIVVGIYLVIVSLLISKLQGEKLSMSSPHFKSMVVGVFLSGAALHFLFELFGLNQYYARQYKPLLK